MWWSSSSSIAAENLFLYEGEGRGGYARTNAYRLYAYLMRCSTHARAYITQQYEILIFPEACKKPTRNERNNIFLNLFFFVILVSCIHSDGSYKSECTIETRTWKYVVFFVSNDKSVKFQLP